MKAKSADDQYSTKEIAQRVKTALQGAFKTEPKPLQSMTPKRRGPQLRKTKKTKV